ncbi:carboxypeptidase-like regulatory domain-containing protein [Desulfurivibrio dismutans]|uniref:carboxypeptidase-like regulatory domain-containing protein n=1 Tax=Desulfurivibrio dismutans TaxID=1398908 RepID=UPI0023DCB884|nr:carboxypeptidase-like regulatory domain-containing protein [Desulfurivibrio alkaliphilus]MDF1615100.1 carboxypeptidase-like regulatory domain-containing protein [Desulfurivibrio alkaliphilus]
MAFSALLIGLGGLLLPAPPAAAHGALVEYRPAPGIVIEARYDTGQPMAEAQIIVYAPDNPTEAWHTGTSDQHGRFSFVPDPELTGTWTVQARQGGHGAMAHIELAAADTQQKDQATGPAAGPPATTSGQRWLMAGAVIWGFIGTALFFRRRPKN